MSAEGAQPTHTATVIMEVVQIEVLVETYMLTCTKRVACERDELNQ